MAEDHVGVNVSYTELAPSYRPSVDDVALLLRTRTVGPGPHQGLGGDTGLQDHTTFSNTTRPTAAEVEDLISTATGVVTSSLVGFVPETAYPAVSHAIALYAAILVEVSFFRDQASDESLTVLRSLYDAGLGAINAQIDDDVVPGTPQFGTVTVRSSIEPVVPWPDALPPGWDPAHGSASKPWGPAGTVP